MWSFERRDRFRCLVGRSCALLDYLRKERCDRACVHDWDAVSVIDARIEVVHDRMMRWSREARPSRNSRLYQGHSVKAERLQN
jgi:hypothetical protein